MSHLTTVGVIKKFPFRLRAMAVQRCLSFHLCTVSVFIGFCVSLHVPVCSVKWENIQHHFFSWEMMVVFGKYTKQVISFTFTQGKNPPTISHLLLEGGNVASRQGIEARAIYNKGMCLGMYCCTICARLFSVFPPLNGHSSCFYKHEMGTFQWPML